MRKPLLRLRCRSKRLKLRRKDWKLKSKSNSKHKKHQRQKKTRPEWAKLRNLPPTSLQLLKRIQPPISQPRKNNPNQLRKSKLKLMSKQKILSSLTTRKTSAKIEARRSELSKLTRLRAKTRTEFK